MSEWSANVVSWLTDYFLLASLLLLAAFAGWGFIRQPARRMALAWATLVSLALLAILTAIPGWPRMAIRTDELNSPTQQAHSTLQTSGVYSLAPLSERPQELGTGKDPAATAAGSLVTISPEQLRAMLASQKKDQSAHSSAISSKASPALEWRLQGKQGLPLLKPSSKTGGSPQFQMGPEWIALGYSLGVVLFGCWILAGAVQVRRLCRQSSEAPGRLNNLLRKVVGPGRTLPRLLLSPRLDQPAALGTWKPTILVPARSVSRVDGSQMEAVLAHEWAHIRGGDLWLLAMARLLMVLLYAHPLYWWLRSRIRLDQEVLADAHAAGEQGAIDYAATLLHWVRLGRQHPGTAPTLALWAKPSELKRRILMLLDPHVKMETNCSGRWRWCAWSIMGLAVLALSLVTFHPAAKAGDENKAKNAVAADKKTPSKQSTSDGSKQKLPVSAQRIQIVLEKTVAVRLAGAVLSEKKTPLAGADVVVISFATGSTKLPQILGKCQTDSNGQFQLEVRRPENQQAISILARAKGYGLGWTSAQSGKKQTVRLAPEVRLRLRLFDLQGQPATKVKVQVSRMGQMLAAGNQIMISPTGLDQGSSVNAEFERAIGLGGSGKMMGKKGQEMSQGALAFLEPPVNLHLWPQATLTDSQGRVTLRGIGLNQGVGLQIRDPRFAIQALSLPPSAKAAPGEITRILSPARLLEGKVTDAATGKPIAGARVKIPFNSFGNRFVVEFAGQSGDLDWKGRRGNGRFQSVLFVANGFPGVGQVDRLPPIQVVTDKKGHYRASLFLAGGYTIEVDGPPGASYLHMTRTVGWPQAAARQESNLPLTPGVWVRGKVWENPANKAVANAQVDFWSPGLKLPQGIRLPDAQTTKADGTFKVMLPQGKWYIFVNGANGGFLSQSFPAQQLVSGAPLRVRMPQGGLVSVEANSKDKVLRPDAWTELNLKIGAAPQECSFELQREILRGKLLGLDGKPVSKALLLFRHPVPKIAPLKQASAGDLGLIDYFGRSVSMDTVVAPRPVKNGLFEWSVCDLNAKYHLFFVDLARNASAMVETSVKAAKEKELTVKMVAAGTATARFVNPRGQPLPGYQPGVWLLLPPGPHATQQVGAIGLAFTTAVTPVANAQPIPTSALAFNPNQLAHDRILWSQVDTVRYGAKLKTDKSGKISFPGLIAGATYRVLGKNGQPRDFKVASGRTLDLKDITIQIPARTNLPRPPKPINTKAQ